jgi:hypothetical protein
MFGNLFRGGTIALQKPPRVPFPPDRDSYLSFGHELFM